jgi:hypothetical protein
MNQMGNFITHVMSGKRPLQVAGLAFMMALMVSFAGCREIFNPQVDGIQNMVTVDGLITDMDAHHQIRLFYTRGYADNHDPVAVSGAQVSVRDDQGNSFYFPENEPGVYVSETPFPGMTGRTYLLQFVTREGKKYESFPQQMLPLAPVDSAFGEFGVLQIVEQNFDGGYFVRTYPGLEIFINIGLAVDSIPQMRYEARILQLYHQEAITGNTYYWRKFGDKGAPNINLPGLGSGVGGLKNHYLTFVPFSRSYYRIPEGLNMNGRYVLIEKFRLNQDSYDFYKGVRSQLSGDGNLFDPIAPQIKGNIVCISHPDETVLGLFEVSSTGSVTYSVYAVPETGNIQVLPFNDLNYLPATGSVFLERPYFWRWV